jgi:UDP-N-acetylmuramoylalanine--D-glutamate ligase
VDYGPLGRTIAARTAPTLVVTMPDNGPRIGEAVRQHTDGRVEIRAAVDLDTAVDAAYAWAPPRGVVLLSPAAPSFGRFGDYRERAAAFAAAASRCGTLS